MKTLFAALVAALTLSLGAADSTQLLTSKDAPRVSNSTALVDFWSVETGPCKLISLYGYNAGSAGFVEIFDTASTNPVVAISGWSSLAGVFTNTVPKIFGTGDAIQLTNSLAGLSAGIYWVSVSATNTFSLCLTRAHAIAYAADTVLTGSSLATNVTLVPNHTFKVAATDNYSCVVQSTGIPFGRGLLVATSATGGTYTVGGTNITVCVTVGSP